MPHPSPTFPDRTNGDQPNSRSCKQLMELGYVAGKRVTLYGEHFEIASDPFMDGNWVAVRVITENDPAIRTIRLPISILLGLTNLLPKNVS